MSDMYTVQNFLALTNSILFLLPTVWTLKSWSSFKLIFAEIFWENKKLNFALEAKNSVFFTDLLVSIYYFSLSVERNVFRAI